MERKTKCTVCGETNHLENVCFFVFPDKAPQEWLQDQYKRLESYGKLAVLFSRLKIKLSDSAISTDAGYSGSSNSSNSTFERDEEIEKKWWYQSMLSSPKHRSKSKSLVALDKSKFLSVPGRTSTLPIPSTPSSPLPSLPPSPIPNTPPSSPQVSLHEV